MKNIETLVGSLKTDLSAFHPHIIASAFLYGGCLYPEDACPDIQVRVGLVFNDSTAANIRHLVPLAKKYRKQRVVFPFALSRTFLLSSLDSFPLEILEFQARHRPILGEPPFASLTVEDKNIRLQCERELKGKGMHLRSALFHRNNDRELHELIHRSSEDFHRIYLGILKMKGEAVDLSRAETAKKVSALCGLENDALYRVAKNDFPGKHVYEFFVHYLEQIDKLSLMVDGGRV